MGIPAHIKYIVFSAFFVLASINFTKTALEIVENSKRLDELSQEVSELEEEKIQLEEQVAYKKTDEYIEEKARNDLNLIKPGEKVYVLAEKTNDIDLESTVLGLSTKQKMMNAGTDQSNIQKWVELFTQPL